MYDKMTKAQFRAWLKSRGIVYYSNPWNTYEEIKGLVKRELCNFHNNPDWKLYDYYQPMIVEISGVFNDSRAA